MKESFRDKLHLSKKNKALLETINSIIDEYLDEDYKLTLRQLYYQLVSRDIIPNQFKEYVKLSALLVKGRMAGFVDWDAIEDRIRTPYLPYWVTGIQGALEDTADQYRLDRQAGQNSYIELWVEKDALSGVLRRVTSYYHIRLMVNRGYSSCTAMHDAYERFLRHDDNKDTYVLYLGDHDPSGLDMCRDIEDRLAEFGVHPSVVSVALTYKQIKKYTPPSNPTKTTDPRADWYIKKFGGVCWEVDALKPEILNTLVVTNIEKLIDMELFRTQIRQEEKDKKKLRAIIK